MYADDHKGKYPDTLDELIPYLKSRRRNNDVRSILQSPRKPKGFHGPSYILVKGLTTASSGSTILIYENPAFCNRYNNIVVGFVDGHVETMRLSYFREMLKKQRSKNNKTRKSPSAQPQTF
jgi:prepilin-type processing-associated H-X9-DG protein